MMKEGQPRSRNTKDKLLQFYRDQAGTNGVQSADPNIPVTRTSVSVLSDVHNIDGLAFQTQSYMDKHLREKDLSDLMLEEKVLTEQIRSLDSEMQTLMYDNYSKFISATDTIRLMKSDFKFVENEMNCLVKNMASISSLSEQIRDTLVSDRNKLKTLTATQQTLHKMKHLVELPGRLRTYVAEGKLEAAVNDLNQAKFILKSYHNTPSFKNIRKDCHQIAFDIRQKLWQNFERATDANDFLTGLKTLRQLGLRTSKLSASFVDHARDHLQAMVIDLQLKDLCEEAESSSSSHEALDSSKHQIPNHSKLLTDGGRDHLLRPDVLHFANHITSSLLNELMTYVTAYTSLFALSTEDADATDTILEIVADQPETEDFDLDYTDLESRLSDLVQEVLDLFFKLVEDRFTESQDASADTDLLVRAVDRIHGRVQAFTRTYTTAVQGMLCPPSIDGSLGSEDAAATGHLTTVLCGQFAKRALDLVHTVAQTRTDLTLSTLKEASIDCVTGLRQQLINPVGGTMASMDMGSPQSTGVTEQQKGINRLNSLCDVLNATLVRHVRQALEAQEIFLSTENTFANRPHFGTHFCLFQLRERLVVGFLRHLFEFLHQLATTAAGRIPSPILLILAKLCTSWANAGTVDQLLSIPEEMLSRVSKPWSPNTNYPGSFVFGTEPIRPTATRELTDRFAAVATQLLIGFVRLEGTNLAQLLRKSVEARDWLKNLEPRSVRSVVKRVIEDLTTLDHQIGQLFSSGGGSRSAKDRLSDSRSGRSLGGRALSNLRPSGSSRVLLDKSTTGVAARCASSASHTGHASELDPSLATQLRRLFTQRVDIFAPVEANRESLLLGVIKIGLKSLVECVRLQTFGRFGLQQIQVDCRFLQIHLWHFVNDEKLIGTLLDDVIYSVVQRCVDPQLMEDSIVEAICDRP